MKGTEVLTLSAHNLEKMMTTRTIYTSRPGIHCLRMRYKNLMNLIIKSSRDANSRHTHKR